MAWVSCIRLPITWLADWPAANRSRPRGPSRGSVRCWVNTAPTPALAYGQRLPTPMLEVVTAAPIIPVRRHIPTSEKVIESYHHSFHVDLDQNTGARKAIDNESGTGREDALEVLAHHLIDRLAVGTIRDIDGELTDIVETGTGFLKQHLDIGHRLSGLSRSVAIADKLAIQRAAGLTAQVDALPRTHRHGKLAAQILAISVLLAGLELA